MTTIQERLRDTASKGISIWGDLQMEAAKEIEILTAEREAYAGAMDRMKAALAQPQGEIAPKANMFHDAGAIAQCHYCKRYTLDRKALESRQPVCSCGKNTGWCGSFKAPGPDAAWHGPAPAAILQSTAKLDHLGDDNKMVALTDEDIVALAHRSATQYTHRSDQAYHSYGFVRHTLIDFVRKVEARMKGVE
jgi:hypothetical protein